MKRKKILSVILAISLGVSAFPFAAVAGDSDDSYYSEYSDAVGIIDDNPEVEEELNSKLGCGIAEIESLREENVKHYQLADGTYQAFSFGAPVHRLDGNGKWQNIDNRLYKENDVYRTNDGRFSFASEISDGNIYTIDDGKYVFSLGLLSEHENSAAEVTNHKERGDLSSYKTDEEKIASFTDIDTTTVRYSDVLPNIDFEYIISANDVKENIILKNADLPSLPTYAKVTDSTLSTYYYYYDNITSGTVNIGLYKCENTWSESSLTWNVANSYDNMAYPPLEAQFQSQPLRVQHILHLPGLFHSA